MTIPVVMRVASYKEGGGALTQGVWPVRGQESEEKGWWMEGLGEPPHLPKAGKQPTAVQQGN